MHRTLPVLIALAALCLAVTTPSAQDPNDWKKERKKAIAEMLDRLDESTSLRWNASQMSEYSRFEGDEVVPRLLDIYRRPPGEHTVNMPYLAGAYLKRRLDLPDNARFLTRIEASESDVKELRKFLGDHCKKAEHVWGVYCAGCILAIQRDAELSMELMEMVGDDRLPEVNRAALLEALARSGVDYLRRALEVMLLRNWKDKPEDAVLLEAAAWSAARVYKALHKEKQPVLEEWRLVMDEIAKRVDDEDSLPRTRREAALALQHAFGTKFPYQYSSMWKLMFDTGMDPLGDDDGRTVASFMGLDVFGHRILFLIDASDSMLNPLSDAELDSVKGPITGDKRGRKGDAYEIDWSKVKNRFDAARENVKWTLSRLERDKQVAVILFGDDARALGATPKFITASKGNVRKIFASLDSIRPQEAPANMQSKRPYGVLLGETNYYHALLAAYRMGKSGMIKSPREHWDLKLVEEGGDSIFLLSDGAPIRDGFNGRSPKIEREYSSWRYYNSKQPGEGEWVDFPAVPAQPEREVESRDPETGAITKHKIPAQPARPAYRMWRKREVTKLSYDSYDDNGPYASMGGSFFAGGFELENMLDEIERMNLVRRVRIQCIGVGEAQMGWLRPIANKGRGKAVFFGKDGMKEADGNDRRLPDGFPDDFPIPGRD